MRREDELDAEIEREYRIELVARVALALVDGVAPDAEAGAFVGSALLSYLRGDGALVRDCLRLLSPRGSHRRPDVVARAFLSRSSSMKGDSGVRIRDRERY